MKAAVTTKPGGPAVIELHEKSIPSTEEDPSGKDKKGQQVAAIMGDMGRDFDGGYAEYAIVPEMFQTVSGSLIQALEVKENEVLFNFQSVDLIRPIIQ